MRYPKKRDLNEREIINALRKLGAVVTQLDDGGVPDLLVGYQGQTHLLEVKLPSKKDGTAHKRAEGELTPAQATWWQSWAGRPAVIVRSVADAIAAVTACNQEPTVVTK